MRRGQRASFRHPPGTPILIQSALSARQANAVCDHIAFALVDTTYLTGELVLLLAYCTPHHASIDNKKGASAFRKVNSQIADVALVHT